MVEEELIYTQRVTTKIGNSVEDYFYLKLKKFLKANEDFRGYYSIKEHIQKLKDSVLNYLKENAKTDNEISDKMKIAGINLICQAEKLFNINSTKIQIDSFFPGISGKTVKLFYGKVDEYSYSSHNFIDSIKDENFYNLIVESTHCITSNINKKRKQLERYFKIFNITKKLYINNQEMLKDFYINFLKCFKIIDNEENISHEELIKKSNYIYIICSNKNYYKTKLFQESMYDKKKFQELVDELLSLQTMEKNKTEDKGKKKENKNKSKDKKGDKKKIKGERNQKQIIFSNNAQSNNKNNDEDPKEPQVYKEQTNQNKEDSKNKEERNNDCLGPKGQNNINCGEDDKIQEKNCKKSNPRKYDNGEENVEDVDDIYEHEETKNEGNIIIEKKNEKGGEKDDNINNEEEKEYDPKKYIIEFRNVLNMIENEKEKFLLVYLDSYDKLFVPYSLIKDGLFSLNIKYEKLLKDYEALGIENKKFRKDYENMVIANQKNEKIIKENNDLLKKIRDLHPELFE